jgi:5-methylcytosine-specific restriction endonuclease McrA
MRFELSHDRRNISDEDILSDMRRVAVELRTFVLRQRDYNEHGKFAVKTAINRFGAWSTAVERAELQKSVERQISDDQLLHNLLRVWTTLARQPLYSEVQKPLSEYHVATYERRFGSWRLALEAFVEWANQKEIEPPECEENVVSADRKTPRQPDLRLRFRVLVRDRFTCCACGDSPANSPGVSLEVDHVVPWSLGGVTVEDNLQTLCARCNNGKSNLPLMNVQPE